MTTITDKIVSFINNGNKCIVIGYVGQGDSLSYKFRSEYNALKPTKQLNEKIGKDSYDFNLGPVYKIKINNVIAKAMLIDNKLYMIENKKTQVLKLSDHQRKLVNKCSNI